MIEHVCLGCAKENAKKRVDAVDFGPRHLFLWELCGCCGFLDDYMHFTPSPDEDNLSPSEIK